jgi:hypothetical protein
MRRLIIGLVVVFLVGFLVFRVLGDDEGSPGTTTPIAVGSTTTAPDGSGTVTTVLGGSTSTSVPGSSGSTSALGPLQSIKLDVLFEGMNQPTVVTAPKGDDRLFVVQRVGVIRILDANNELLDPAFLDLTDRVLAGGIEQGMLGLAFHPDYANNGRFFVYYTDKGGRRQLSEFEVSTSDPNRARADSERVLIELEQPPNASDIRHYAGQLAFDPEGLLMLSMGDGADSRAQAQDPNTFFGKVHRIDVDSGDPYAIPPNNPFAEGGGLPEVWAYGLRNPWRFSIDPVDRLIYIADVGHADEEEINVLPIDEGGFNLGWSDMEGTRCFHKQDCNPDDYTSPVLTYSHDDGNCSVTGGAVYRGEEIPELNGTYFYSDWCKMWIKSFKYVDGEVTEEHDWTEELGTLGQVDSFGIGGDGELYLVTYEGAVAKFTAVR